MFPSTKNWLSSNAIWFSPIRSLTSPSSRPDGFLELENTCASTPIQRPGCERLRPVSGDRESANEHTRLLKEKIPKESSQLSPTCRSQLQAARLEKEIQKALMKHHKILQRDVALEQHRPLPRRSQNTIGHRKEGSAWVSDPKKCSILLIQHRLPAAARSSSRASTRATFESNRYEQAC
jgi:hypothetical protein